MGQGVSIPEPRRVQLSLRDILSTYAATTRCGETQTWLKIESLPVPTRFHTSGVQACRCMRTSSSSELAIPLRLEAPENTNEYYTYVQAGGFLRGSLQTQNVDGRFLAQADCSSPEPKQSLFRQKRQQATCCLGPSEGSARLLPAEKSLVPWTLKCISNMPRRFRIQFFWISPLTSSGASGPSLYCAR